MYACLQIWAKRKDKLIPENIRRNILQILPHSSPRSNSISCNQKTYIKKSLSS